MRTIITMICVAWIVLMIWFYIYDDLSLFFFGERVEGQQVEVQQFDPVVSLKRYVGLDYDWITSIAFPRVIYNYRVKDQTFSGDDLHMAVLPPGDMSQVTIVYDPSRPEVSKIDGHLEPWPYATTLLALILWMVILFRQRVASAGTAAKSGAREPLKQFTVHFNRLKRQWEETSPQTVEGTMQRMAVTWSDDVVVLARPGKSDQLVALARLFIIYGDTRDKNKTMARDATAAFRYDRGIWQAVAEVIHDVPQGVRKSYPGWELVEERIDENRNVLFEELLKRTAKPQSIKLPDDDVVLADVDETEKPPTPPVETPPPSGPGEDRPQAETKNQDPDKG